MLLDLQHHMKDEKSSYDGLMSWADHLKNAAEHVERLAEAVKGKDVEFMGDGVFIHIHGDEAVLDELVKDGLIESEDCEDDDDDICADGDDKVHDSST